MQTVSWTNMADGTREDYQRLKPAFFDYAMDRLVDNVLNLLEQLRGPKLGYPVDRYEHSLQSGSRALRAGEGPDLVVGALLHDVADTIAPDNHSDAAAAILAPYVEEETHWVVKHHGIFQGYYYFHHVGGDRNARNRFADSPHFDACARFCERYDQNCFDPDYPNLDITDFRPMLDEVFSRPSKLGHLPPEAKEPADNSTARIRS